MASRHGIVSAEAAEDLVAVRTRLDAAPARLRQLLDATAAEQLSRAWDEELDRGEATPAQDEFIRTGAVADPIAGGLIARTGHPDLWAPFEFGTNDREKTTTYYRSGTAKRQGGTVTRRTRRQLPPRKPGGYVAYPAGNRLGTRVFKMWRELIQKVIGDAFDGGNH